MNFPAIQHLATENFCYCLDKDTLVINIKTGKEITAINLIYGDPFAGGILGGNWKWEGKTLTITEKKDLQYHTWWTTKISPEHKRAKYYFEVFAENETFFFLEDGFYTKDELEHKKGPLQCFTFPWMNPIDICKTPDWVKNTVWYQIFPERFCNGDPSINTPQVLPWGNSNHQVKNKEAYGGDLQGIINKLDYLKDLGIGGLYLNPINLAYTTHKYDTIDYYEIDPVFGSKKTMKELSQKAHERGIKIMLDGVFNHCGWLFPQWQNVVKNGPKSPYYSWFMVNKWPFDKNWENSSKGNFYAFAFADFMPKLNTNNPEVQKYLLDVCEFWVKKYDIDGLRLDVANELSHDFCRELHKKMKSLKPDFYIIGEIWHNSMPWLRGDEFDSVMNYPLAEAINRFFLDNKQKKQTLVQDLNRCNTMYPIQITEVLFNLLDSHDTIRLITKTGSENKTWQQLVMLFSMPGTTCIYYGTEVLLKGNHDPDCRRCMPWDEIEEGEFDDRIEFTKKLIQLRKTEPALSSINYTFENSYNNERIIELLKTDEKTKTQIKLIFNASDSDIKILQEIEPATILLSKGFSTCENNNVLEKDGFVMIKL